MADAAPMTLAEGARAARLALDLAPSSCRTAGIEACDWYHGWWPSLRLLGLGATPERHAEFWTDALRMPSGVGRARVLVCGCADAGMLSVLLADQAVATQEITVIDRCATPLALCRAFAAERGASIRTRVVDARELVEPDFDLIVTHSLLPMVPDEDKLDLVASWARALRPGGRIVTVARLDPGRAAGLPGARPDDVGIAAFAERARRAALEQREASADARLDPERLAEAAGIYASRLLVHPLRSPAELEALSTRAGIRIERLDVRAVTGSLDGRPGAVGGADRSAEYVHFIGARP